MMFNFLRKGSERNTFNKRIVHFCLKQSHDMSCHLGVASVAPRDSG